MNEYPEPQNDDPIVPRLQAIGRQPVDPALQSQHLTAMGSLRSTSSFRTSLAGRLKIGAGVLAGFLLGASGLTTVGALGPLQPIAATAVEAVSPLDVPHGKKDQAEKEAKAHRLEDGSIGTARNWVGCVPGKDGVTFAGNHGQYLKQERAKTAAEYDAAKASDCGKPLGAEDESDDVEATENDAPKAADGAGKSDEEHGKATAPGQADKDDKAKDEGEDEDGTGNAGKSDEEHGKSTDAGPPASAGKSDTAPASPATPAAPASPEDDDSADPATPATPATPGNDGGADDASDQA
jgi:hypothetical protein